MFGILELPYWTWRTRYDWRVSKKGLPSSWCWPCCLLTLPPTTEAKPFLQHEPNIFTPQVRYSFLPFTLSHSFTRELFFTSLAHGWSDRYSTLSFTLLSFHFSFTFLFLHTEASLSLHSLLSTSRSPSSFTDGSVTQPSPSTGASPSFLKKNN